MYNWRPSTLQQRDASHQHAIPNKRRRLTDSTRSSKTMDVSDTDLLRPVVRRRSPRLAGRANNKTEEQEEPRPTLFNIPEEIRRQILEHVVTLRHDVSVRCVHTICETPSCGIFSDPSLKELEKDFSHLSGILQIPELRHQAVKAFYRANIWRLERLHLADMRPPVRKEFPAQLPRPMTLTQLIVGAPFAQHFSMKMHFSPLMEQCFLPTIPEEIADEPRKVQIWIRKELDEGHSTLRTRLTEYDISNKNATELNGFVMAKLIGVCRPRTLSIDVVIHNVTYMPTMSQCGASLKLHIDFVPSANKNKSASLAAVTKIDAQSRLDPHRNALLPLLQAGSVSRVTVHRKWILKVAVWGDEHAEGRQPTNPNSRLGGPPFVEDVQLIPMSQDFQYKTVMEMLAEGGHSFRNFLDRGAKEAGVKPDHLLEIMENKSVEDVVDEVRAGYLRVVIRQPVAVKQSMMPENLRHEETCFLEQSLKGEL